MGCSKSSPKREVYSNTILPQETRKTSNTQPNFTPKTTVKRRRKNTKKNTNTWRLNDMPLNDQVIFGEIKGENKAIHGNKRQ